MTLQFSFAPLNKLPGAPVHLSFLPAERLCDRLHSHRDFAEVFWVLTDRITHREPETATPLRRGMVGFVPSSACHAFEPASECLGAEVAVINAAFDSGLLDSLLRDAPLPETPGGGVRFGCLGESGLERCVSLLTELAKTPYHRIFLLEHLLYEVIYAVAFHSAAAAGEVLPVWLARACAEMKKPANLRAGLPRFRQLAGRAGDHLGRCCRQYCQASPTELLIRWRLAHAAELLLLSRTPVERVALESGFTAMSHFYARFQRQYGLSPRQYRLRHRRES